MVFTLQHDIFIGMAYFRSGIYNPITGWQYSLRVREMFPEILVIVDVFQQHCMRVVERYLNTGNVTKQKPAGKPSTLNEEVVEDIRTRMQRNPNTSIRRISLQTGLLLILPIPPMFIPTVTF
jgi:hypothetical protein